VLARITHRYVLAIVARQLASHRAVNPGGAAQQPAHTAEFAAGFAALICAAQESVRQCSSGERAAASLRDVARCAKVFCWLLLRVGAAAQHSKSSGSSSSSSSGSSGSSGSSSGSGSGSGSAGALFGGAEEGPKAATRRAVVLALAFCYHARLPRDDREVSHCLIISAALP
jgi:uncharacterized membrane protein YgcG